MHHYQTNILEDAIVCIEYFYEYTLFFRITQGVDVETIYIFFTSCKCVHCLGQYFMAFKMVPLTTLAAMKIGFRDTR